MADSSAPDDGVTHADRDGSRADGAAAVRSSSGVQDMKDVQELRAAGNEAFNGGQFEDAIESYANAIRLARPLAESSDRLTLELHETLMQELTTLYSNRSAAFASLCRQYLNRPAARSETSALFGLEPGHLAALALGDAEKVVAQRPDWPKAYSRLGTALYLSERYHEAETAFLKGLDLEPTNAALREGLQEVSRALKAEDEEDDGAEASGGEGQDGHAASDAAAALPEGRDSAGRRAAMTPKKRSRSGRLRSYAGAADDWECTLCLKLLFEPVTTPCGHTFCRACFARAMDHSHKCPCCRTVLHIGRDLPVTVVMASILQKSFPQEYMDRAAEEAQARLAASGVGSGVGGTGTGGEVIPALPLFVMSTINPGERMALNIFEPRYRLLVRRAMEGNRRIGMAQVRRRDHNLDDVAVEAEVMECIPQPDGRYFIEVVGRRRVEVLEARELDGYRVARARVLTDEPPAPDSPEAAELPELCAQVGDQVEALVGRLRTWAAASGARGVRMRELIQSAGPRPPADKPEPLSFWAATLAVCFAPDLNHDDRTRMLAMRSTHERLTYVKQHLSRLPVSDGLPAAPGCTIM